MIKLRRNIKQMLEAGKKFHFQETFPRDGGCAVGGEFLSPGKNSP